jgi:hypothetical protein
MHILAIDPGAKGGLVYGEYKNPAMVNMPAALDTTDGLIELLDLLVDVRSNFPNIRAVVEKVGGYVGEAQPASSAFKFGGVDMAVKAMLVASRIPYVLVAPVSWQRHLDLPKRGRTAKGKTQHKRDLRDAAQALFPGRKVTLQTADALLLFHLAHAGKIAI